MRIIGVDISNKLAYTLILFGILAIIAVGINAYGTSNPSVLGHTFGELTPPSGCAVNQVVRWTGSTWDCVAVSSGDITSVVAGTGLTGGATSGDATLNLANPIKTCSAGQVMSSFNLGVSTAPTCVTPSAGSGDITSVNAGTGLLGGGITGSVTLSSDTNYLQRRISTGCPAGQFISAVSSAGVPTCSVPSPSVWPASGWVAVATDIYNRNVNPSNTCQINGLWSCADSNGNVCWAADDTSYTDDYGFAFLWNQGNAYWTCDGIDTSLKVTHAHCCGP